MSAPVRALCHEPDCQRVAISSGYCLIHRIQHPGQLWPCKHPMNKANTVRDVFGIGRCRECSDREKRARDAARKRKQRAVTV